MSQPSYVLSTNNKYWDKTGSSRGFKTVSFETVEQLKNIAKKDWSPCVFTDGVRLKDNFEFTSFVFTDIDEGCSIDRFGELFNGYEYYLLTSRNHGKIKPATKTKPEAPAQDRYHVLFPLQEVCYDLAGLEALLRALTDKDSTFPFDKSVKDGARFYFGFDGVEVFYHEGEKHFSVTDNSFIELPLEPLREIKEKQILDSLILAGQQGYLDNYADWLSVGTALKNESYPFEAWVQVSKPGCDQRDMQAKWNGFNKSGTTAGTLVQFARMANPGLLLRGQPLKQATLVSHYDAPKKAPDADRTPTEIAIERINQRIETAKTYQEFELTQFGTRDRVEYHNGHLIRYVTDRQGWFIWNGSRWQEEADGKVMALISKTIEGVKTNEAQYYPFTEADKSSPIEIKIAAQRYKDFANYLKSSQSSNHVDGTEKLLRSVPSLDSSDTQYDNDAMLFNCENGTVNLETGELLPHDKNNLCSKISGIVYDKNAKAPLWEKMLNDVMCGRKGLVDWLQEYFGYCLTGLPPERVIAIFWGSGANGKSSVINVLSHVLGMYSMTARPETFMKSDNMDKIGQDLVTLRGARNIIMQETAEGQKLDVQRIKAFTGRDKIKGRYLFSRKEITFVNTGKIILSTNHKPRISGDDKAMWDRVKLIPFERIFSESERDQDLPGHIMANESSGVLNWMIEGCLRLKKRGWKFVETAEIAQASAEYRKEEDKMGQFIEENCTFSGTTWVGGEASVQAKTIYGKYKEWCEETGIMATSHVRFFKELSQGRQWIQKSRDAHGMVYSGIRLRNADEEFVSHEEAHNRQSPDEDNPL
jgi:P4 family phage/plasmid primase-like protien